MKADIVFPIPKGMNFGEELIDDNGAMIVVIAGALSGEIVASEDGAFYAYAHGFCWDQNGGYALSSLADKNLRTISLGEFLSHQDGVNPASLYRCRNYLSSIGPLGDYAKTAGALSGEDWTRIFKLPSWDEFVGHEYTESDRFAVSDTDAEEIIDVYDAYKDGIILWSDESYDVRIVSEEAYNSVCLVERRSENCVGFYSGAALWVNPGHRGLGLGGRLVIEAARVRKGSPALDEIGVGYSYDGMAVHESAYPNYIQEELHRLADYFSMALAAQNEEVVKDIVKCLSKAKIYGSRLEFKSDMKTFLEIDFGGETIHATIPVSNSVKVRADHFSRMRDVK